MKLGKEEGGGRGIGGARGRWGGGVMEKEKIQRKEEEVEKNKEASKENIYFFFNRRKVERDKKGRKSEARTRKREEVKRTRE